MITRLMLKHDWEHDNMKILYGFLSFCTNLKCDPSIKGNVYLTPKYVLKAKEHLFHMV